MPWSDRFGMNIYDRDEAAARGIQAGQLVNQQIQTNIEREKLRIAQQEAALNRQMHMERAVALEAMNKEIRDKLAIDPTQNEEELRIKTIGKYAPELFGMQGAMQFYQQAPYRRAQLAAETARAEAYKRQADKSMTPPKMYDVGGDSFIVQGPSGSIHQVRKPRTPKVWEMGENTFIEGANGSMHQVVRKLDDADKIKLNSLYGQLDKLLESYSLTSDQNLRIEIKKIRDQIEAVAGKTVDTGKKLNPKPVGSPTIGTQSPVEPGLTNVEPTAVPVPEPSPAPVAAPMGGPIWYWNPDSDEVQDTPLE